ncbi:MAG: S26 family signal peptidase, partial [Muribaculaceae bacterium]|nr:S26 family signal peptidase [Muribaculaceae bacterium]
DIVWRPVDRRENYVKRAIGLPGERLEIRNDTILINGVAIPDPDNVQFNYIIPVSGTIPDEKWMEIGVRADDRGNGPITNDLSGFKFFDCHLTA